MKSRAFALISISTLIFTTGVAISSADLSPAAPLASATPQSSASAQSSPTPGPSTTPFPSSTPAPSATPAGSTGPNQPRKILTGWIPYYSMKTALPSAILNADLVSQVSPFWYTLKDQNTIADLYTPANPGVPISTPIQSMQAAGFKIIPTITDDTDINPKTGKSTAMVLSNLLANSTSRANIVKTIVNLVISNNFDGVDLDFENFAYVDPISSWPTTQVRWVQFLSDLSTALHSQGKILSITTPPLFDPASGKKGYYLYAWSQVANLIDQLHIMTYDYSTSSPGPIGPLQWTTNAVTYAVSVVPASKVYIGLPGYGRDWVTKVVGTCPTSPINYAKTVAPGVVSTFVMHNVASLAATYGATPTYNQSFAESSFTYQKQYNGTTSTGALTTCTAYRTVWYQDATSFTVRANLVSRYRLGGLSEWTFGMEDPSAFQAIRVVAQSIAPDSLIASLATDSSNISIGTPTNLIGTFTLPDKSPVVGIPVHLQTEANGGAWTTVQDGITAADGTFKASLLLTQSTNVRMFSDGTWERMEGDTPPIAINVSPLLTWNIPASMRKGVSYPVTAQVKPAVAGITVTLNNGATSLTDANGNVSFVVTNKTVGFIPYQVSIPASNNLAATQTAFVIVWVR